MNFSATFCMCFSSLCIGVSVTSKGDVPETISSEIVSVESKICREIDEQKEKPPWAGRYYRGDFFSGPLGYLILAPKNGFVSKSYSEFGTSRITHQCYGDVQQQGENLLLLSCKLRRGESRSKAVLKYHLVNWGKTRYLIEEDQFTDFANSVNSGLERSRPVILSDFLVLQDSGGQELLGVPEVPEKYRKLILKEPITGEITSQETAGLDSRQIVATLNVGANQGVFRGMKFYSIADTKVSDGAFQAVVTKVSEETCTTMITPFLENEIQPKVGSKLSTIFIKACSGEAVQGVLQKENETPKRGRAPKRLRHPNGSGNRFVNPGTVSLTPGTVSLTPKTLSLDFTLKLLGRLKKFS